MSLVKWVRDEFDRPDWFGRRLADFPAMTEWFDVDLPKVEEFRENGTMVVRAEMPGIDPEHDVEITMVDGTLRIKAERRQETKTEDAKSFRSEFHYGSFARSVALPAGATDKDVSAKYHDGILEVRIPVSEAQAAEKKIPVTTG